MNPREKNMLYLWTFVTDILLLYIFLNNLGTWEIFEYTFLYLVFITHILFYISLYFEFIIVLDFLHVFVFILIGFGVVIKNVYLIFIILIFSAMLQIQWICLDKCLINSVSGYDKINYGFSKIIRTIVMLYTCYLSYILGKLNSSTSVTNE